MSEDLKCADARYVNLLLEGARLESQVADATVKAELAEVKVIVFEPLLEVDERLTRALKLIVEGAGKNWTERPAAKRYDEH